jgi:lipopolysaccharide biosynthesis glycosyltransferase
MKTLGLNCYRDSYAPNIKLFVNHYIPDTVERLLYIDCDTIIVGAIEKLFNLNMHNQPVGMVLDSVCMRHKQAIGFSKRDLYFNSGVILYDMKEWRKQNCEERIIDHIINVRSHYLAPDQDVLNIVLKNKIKVLDVKYNLQPFHMVYLYAQYMRYFGQTRYYSKRKIDNAKDNAAIYHTFRYLGEFPWHKDSLHPATAMFDKYMAKSLWKDYSKTETEKNDLVFRIERSLYKLLPKSVFIVIFKICYELFMWKSNMDSLKNMNNSRM